MDDIKGILFAIIKGKGTLSEGPEYFIEPIDDYKIKWSKILVRKKTHKWESDPELHKYLDKKVVIIGEIIETKSTITVDYSKIELLE